LTVISETDPDDVLLPAAVKALSGAILAVPEDVEVPVAVTT